MLINAHYDSKKDARARARAPLLDFSDNCLFYAISRKLRGSEVCVKQDHFTQGSCSTPGSTINFLRNSLKIIEFATLGRFFKAKFHRIFGFFLHQGRDLAAFYVISKKEFKNSLIWPLLGRSKLAIFG